MMIGSSRSGAMVPQTGLKDTGVLVPITGPSGVGKGQLLATVAGTFGKHKTVRFPARIEAICDHLDASMEDLSGAVSAHPASRQAISEDQFISLERAGGFAASWQTEGQSFGVSASILDDLARGNVVVINVAGQVIPHLRAQHSRVHVLYVTSNRVRSSQANSPSSQIPAPPVTIIDNSGPVVDAAEEIRKVLETYIP